MWNRPCPSLNKKCRNDQHITLSNIISQSGIDSVLNNKPKIPIGGGYNKQMGYQMMNNVDEEQFGGGYGGIPVNEIYNKEMTETDMAYMDMITGKHSINLKTIRSRI